MTLRQINKYLSEQHGATVEPGYNYAIFSVHTNNPEQVATLIRENKTVIDAALGQSLLPFACYIRKLSVVVPIPLGVGLNVLADVLAPILAGTDAQLPNWS